MFSSKASSRRLGQVVVVVVDVVIHLFDLPDFDYWPFLVTYQG